MYVLYQGFNNRVNKFKKNKSKAIVTIMDHIISISTLFNFILPIVVYGFKFSRVKIKDVFKQ